MRLRLSNRAFYGSTVEGNTHRCTCAVAPQAYRQRIEMAQEEASRKALSLQNAEEEIVKSSQRLEQRESSLREAYDVLSLTEKKVFDSNAKARL